MLFPLAPGSFAVIGTRTQTNPSVVVTPSQLSSLFLWIDAADYSTLGFRSGSTTQLTAWNDKSGFNRNFIQDGVTYTTGNSYPRYLTSAQSRSKLNCIALSSVSQYNDANALFFVNNKSTDFNAVSSTYTFFAVAKNNSAINGIAVISKSGNTTLRRMLDLKIDYGTLSASAGQGNDADGGVFSTTSPLSTNVYAYRWNSPTSFDGFQNGIKMSSSTRGTPIFGVNTNPISLGLSIGFTGGINYHAESTFNAEICEVILYNRTLSDPEVNQINQYLLSKYSL